MYLSVSKIFNKATDWPRAGFTYDIYVQLSQKALQYIMLDKSVFYLTALL